MSFTRDDGPPEDGPPAGLEGLFPPPDGIELILDADGMLCVFDAQRLARVDDHRVAALAEAGRLGAFAPEVVERSVRLELAAALRVTEYTAGMLLWRAQALLHRYPEVYEALSHAEVTPKHTEILAQVLDELGPDDRARVVGPGLELARSLPVGVFRRRLRTLVGTVRADTLTQRHERALTDRRVVVEEVEDAMAWLHVYAPAVEVHAAHDRITKVAKTVIDADRADADRADADRAGVVRSLDQARTDVLCDLLIDGQVDAHPKSARGIRAGVVVTVPALSLLDDAAADTAPAVVEGVGPVPIGRARQLCGGGEDWMRVLTHPETGIVVSVGRDRYKPPAGLKRLVRWRAARCMTPGCNVPATRCEIDHQDDWALGGQTKLTNLSPLCTGHHTIKGTGLWQVTQLDGGVIEWTSPSGRVYLVEPERHLPAFTDTTTPDQPTAPF